MISVCSQAKPHAMMMKGCASGRAASILRQCDARMTMRPRYETAGQFGSPCRCHDSSAYIPNTGTKRRKSRNSPSLSSPSRRRNRRWIAMPAEASSATKSHGEITTACMSRKPRNEPGRSVNGCAAPR